MKSLIVLFFLAAAIHFFLHIPLLFAVVVGFVLWLVWKLKYVILGILGLEMLFGGGDNGGGIDL